MRRKKPRKNVIARIGGKAMKYPSTSKIPGNSRHTMYPNCVTNGLFAGACGSDLPNHDCQKYSDIFTLVSACTLCASQASYGPKKFQFGPRSRVASTISVTHSSTNPS